MYIVGTFFVMQNSAIKLEPARRKVPTHCKFQKSASYFREVKSSSDLPQKIKLTFFEVLSISKTIEFELIHKFVIAYFYTLIKLEISKETIIFFQLTYVCFY